MAIGIDPTIDFAFKRLLGNPEHPEITIHFLNAVLGGSRRIVSVEFLNPFLDQETDQDKLSVLDIHAKDDQGRSLNIEIQTRVAAGLRERLTYYVSCLYVGQLEKGEHYKTLRPAISICVLDGVLFPDVSEWHLDFCLPNGRTGLVFTKNSQIHLIELPKLNPDRGSVADATPLEKWVYFFDTRRSSHLKRSRDALPTQSSHKPQECSKWLPEPPENASCTKHASRWSAM